jgi:hypothetical protein
MKKKKGGKSTIITDVMAQGFTARTSEKAVTAVINHIKLGLWWGEPVEIPGGTIQAKVRKGKPRRKFQRFRDIQQGKVAYRIVSYPGRRRVVKFTPDLTLDLTSLPPPPLPETPEQVETQQLASELLEMPADKATMATLQQAVTVHPFKPGALLRRLQEFKNRGWKFGSVALLARQVSTHHWL